MSASGETDVAIVGAGAAGIAAARKVAAAGRRFVLIEANDRLGGRCVTDSRTFGVPFDRGAHWIHMPDINPLAKLTPRGSGLDLYPGAACGSCASPNATRAKARWRIISRRSCAATARFKRLRAARWMSRARRRWRRRPGEWRASVEFVLGPFGCGKNLDEILRRWISRARWSAMSIPSRPSGSRHAGGAGSPKASPGADQHAGAAHGCRRAIPLKWETSRGRIVARAAIVTASTGLLDAGKIKFVARAASSASLRRSRKLSLGSYDHVALELKGNPLQLQNDDLVFERASGPRTAAMLANVSGTPLVHDRGRWQVRQESCRHRAPTP